jgi:6,7-dimethyl-8-ribityllumazine synthase
MAKPRKAAEKSEPPLKDAHILIVEAAYYRDIAALLLKGATRALKQAGAAHDKVSVPGALEIPPAIVIALDAAERRGRAYDGVVALGCVIRGETSHYDIVAGESARALMDLAVSHNLALGNGVLTVENGSQARVRAGERDKGGAAAIAALAMIAVKRRLKLA